MLKLLAVAAAFCTPALAQTNAAATPAADPFHGVTRAELLKHGQDLMEKAGKAANGNVSVTLEKYPDHFTMLSARTKSGGGELHEHFADIFIILEGEATEVTGGHLVDESGSSATGERRGTRVEGGVEHPMRPGDIVHIAPGTPHQTVLAPGKTLLYYVVKVQQP